MPQACSVLFCTNRSNVNTDKLFYSFPSIRDCKSRPIPEGITRREQWVQALRRKDLTPNKIRNIRICSDHFIRGKPSSDALDPDYVPSLKMGYELMNYAASLARFRDKIEFKSTEEIMKKEVHKNCNGAKEAQVSSEPSCCICLQSITPLFPANTMMDIDNATLSFKDIYASLTRINLDEDKTQETCLACFRSIINAFLTIKRTSDMTLKDRQGKEITGIARNNVKSKVVFKREDDYISTHSVKDCVEISTEEKKSKMLSTKEILEKRNHIPQELLQKQKTQTIFRCRYCQNLFFDHEISTHAKICPDPKKSNVAKSVNKSNVVNKSIGVADSSTNSCDKSYENNKKLINEKNQKDLARLSKIQTQTINTSTSENDLANKLTSNDLLLLCKLCKAKLYMSQMEDHKKTCRPKPLKSTTLTEKAVPNTSNIDKSSENSIFPQKRKVNSTEKTYTCQLCNKQCITENLLMMHIMKHASENYQCKVCSMKFEEKELLREHERKHYTQKQLICKICRKGFNSIRNLRSHMGFHKTVNQKNK